MNAERRTYSNLLRINRDGRTGALVRTGTKAMRCFNAPACIKVSRVYEYFECTTTRDAAARVNARNPDVASGTLVPTARLTTALPNFCNALLVGEKNSSV